MMLFKSLEGEKFRRLFLSFFAGSSLLPLLILIFVEDRYLLPAIDADRAACWVGNPDGRAFLRTVGHLVVKKLPAIRLASWKRRFSG